MKQDKDNQIDLLLRSLARRERGESRLDMGNLSAREEEALSDHLDADELNSFAEGVVPARARARYIAHLADCESCRGSVVNLAQASGAAARSTTFEQQTGAGFWQKMASLFSPPVLRYAVPALALTAVIAISFFALRPQRRPDLVAQNARIDSAAPAPAPANRQQQQPESPAAQSNNEAPAKTQGGTEPRTRVDSSGEKKSFLDDRSSVAQAPVTTADAEVPSPGYSKKDLRQSKQSEGAAGSQPSFAPEPQPAPPPAKAALSEPGRFGAIQKEEPAQRRVQAIPVDEEKNQQRDEAGRHGPSRSGTTVSGKRADGLMNEREETRAKSKEDSDDEVVTRTVSGRRFRRQSNAWIDTAYDSARATINVSRGSEQFRVLVADEPGIRTIAEKLNGVVIVMWNGRAYRIQ